MALTPSSFIIHILTEDELFLNTEDGNRLITEDSPITIFTEDAPLITRHDDRGNDTWTENYFRRALNDSLIVEPVGVAVNPDNEVKSENEDYFRRYLNDGN